MALVGEDGVGCDRRDKGVKANWKYIIRLRNVRVPGRWSDRVVT